MRFNYTTLCWLLMLALGSSLTPSMARAQSKKDSKKLADKTAASEPKAGAGKEVKGDSEKLDIRDLEQKYWAPKDTDFSVVQNRAYTKEKRFSGSLQYGPIINDAFNEGYNLGLKANYFWNERSGVQFGYVSFDVSDNSTVKGFANQYGGIRPNIGRVKSMWDIGYSWVPIYAKMSLLGERIIYFDMAITPVIGMMDYVQTTRYQGNKADSSLTYGFDITQYYFLSKHIAIRADLQNRWWNETILDWNSGLKNKSQNTNSTVFFMGVTYYH